MVKEMIPLSSFIPVISFSVGIPVQERNEGIVSSVSSLTLRDPGNAFPAVAGALLSAHNNS